MAKKSKRWLLIVLVLVVLSLIGYLTGFETYNVALIKVEGTITSDGIEDLFTSSPPSHEIVNMIKDANDDPSIKAILIEINSPGGTPVASKEIVDEIKKSDKLVVSYIREIGASGAYWVASSTDYIFADELSIVGSVGVNAASFEISELMKRFNVSYVQMTGGKYKDIGSPFREMSEDEEQRLNEKIRVMHEFFLSDVAENRFLTYDEINEIKNADFYVGVQAIEFGLIDEFGGQDESLDFIAEQLDIEPEVIYYEYTPSFVDVLSGLKSKGMFNTNQILSLR